MLRVKNQLLSAFVMASATLSGESSERQRWSKGHLLRLQGEHSA